MEGNLTMAIHIDSTHTTEVASEDWLSTIFPWAARQLADWPCRECSFRATETPLEAGRLLHGVCLEHRTHWLSVTLGDGTGGAYTLIAWSDRDQQKEDTHDNGR